MSEFVSTDGFEKLPPLCGPTHLAVGVFDGVHLGHREVLALAVRHAKTEGGCAGALTFDPHPSRIFRPESPTLLLLNPEQKDELLEAAGLTFAIHHRFDREFGSIEAKDFFFWLKNRLPSLAAIYVGENFRFGKGRAGDPELLRVEAERCGVRVFSLARVTKGDEGISSTGIRKLVSEGRVREAAGLLGYEYNAAGCVTPGRKLGRKLGFPTLNLPWDPELKPAYGVYSVTLQGPDGIRRKGVANYGLRPTVENELVRPLLETHLLENPEEVQKAGLKEGVSIRVFLRNFIRSETKFESLEELRLQIGRDAAAARDEIL